MQEAFKIIAAFLERWDGEVEGRELEEPPPEVRLRIQAFARGALEAEGREALVRALQDHPEWIAHLAREVKSLRAPPPDPA